MKFILYILILLISIPALGQPWRNCGSIYPPFGSDSSVYTNRGMTIFDGPFRFPLAAEVLPCRDSLGLGFVDAQGNLWIHNGIVWTQATGGTGNVISVFGRGGAVTAQTGDYTVNQIGGMTDTLSHYLPVWLANLTYYTQTQVNALVNLRKLADDSTAAYGFTSRFRTASDINDSLDNIRSEVIPIVRGGTGQTTAATALNALLPSQTGKSGYYASTDGTNLIWVANTSVGSLYSSNGSLTIDPPFGSLVDAIINQGYNFRFTGTDTFTNSIVGNISTATALQTARTINGVSFNGTADITIPAVTSITAGAGLSGGTITTTGTISLPNTGTAGTYGSSTQVAVITTDAQGRITSVTPTTITGFQVSGNYVTFSDTTISAAYTLTSRDLHRRIHCTNGSNIALTIPTGLGASFGCEVVQEGAGTVTPTASGSTIHFATSGHTKSGGQHSAISIQAEAGSNVFFIQGKTQS